MNSINNLMNNFRDKNLNNYFLQKSAKIAKLKNLYFFKRVQN